MITGIIFDFDGVLINSEEFYLNFWKSIYASYQVKIPFVSPQGYSMEQYIGKLGLDTSVLREITELKIKAEDTYMEAVKINSIFLQFIRSQANKCKFIIGSNNNYKNIKKVVQLNNIEVLFSGIVTSEDGLRPKPFPDIYSHCQDILCLSANNILVIEDSKVGIEAAKRAGLRALFLPYPQSMKELEPLLSIYNQC